MIRVRARISILAAFAFALAACSAPYSSEPASSGTSGEPTGDTSAATSAWECYAPQPGHPTDAEKTRFVQGTSLAAQQAEQSFGVPAAALLAMATNEGGYGFTRTALSANNTFGWKWTSAAAAGGRGSYTLSCQPEWDPNNQYVAFTDFRDGFLFVAQKLATLPRYKPTTDKYRADRAAGVDAITAVNAWIDGIADAGYNYDPATYKKTLRSHANDYIAPGATYSETNNLYRFSAGAAAPAPSATTPTAVWISIDAPTKAQVVSGDVPFSATTGGGSVTSVQFLSRAAGDTGAFYLIKADLDAPFGISWATKGWVPNGDYDLRVEAYDGATKIATETVRVTVTN